MLSDPVLRGTPAPHCQASAVASIPASCTNEVTDRRVIGLVILRPISEAVFCSDLHEHPRRSPFVELVPCSADSIPCSALKIPCSIL